MKSGQSIVQFSRGGGGGNALSMVFHHDVARWTGWPVGPYLNLISVLKSLIITNMLQEWSKVDIADARAAHDPSNLLG